MTHLSLRGTTMCTTAVPTLLVSTSGLATTSRPRSAPTCPLSILFPMMSMPYASPTRRSSTSVYGQVRLWCVRLVAICSFSLLTWQLVCQQMLHCAAQRCFCTHPAPGFWRRRKFTRSKASGGWMILVSLVQAPCRLLPTNHKRIIGIRHALLHLLCSCRLHPQERRQPSSSMPAAAVAGGRCRAHVIFLQRVWPSADAGSAGDAVATTGTAGTRTGAACNAAITLAVQWLLMQWLLGLLLYTSVPRGL